VIRVVIRAVIRVVIRAVIRVVIRKVTRERSEREVFVVAHHQPLQIFGMRLCKNGV